ncbi:peptide-methionine (S)-S-oxide reductase MsrA [Planctomicrobium sp.]|jgi:peptide-methionine (S)-S-oxide reductase|nr:peptide-methionine (S)-S-oxide reductase MsrA [Planctomicrobium sp.]MDB4743141.1 peptide-methionine (S)-S-oxide reductase MsrA [Planctomicrobium sp.]MDB4802723.1 peptide-methionine (S)-S-oxide reductase MsrA [bacterium]
MATDLATFGSGCFWCSEAVFQTCEGVQQATSGYMGGSVPNPTYEQICTGTTGHAEVIQVEFDPAVVSFEQLVKLFFKSHDPTTLNRQGHDVGTQYRSAIFAHSAEQLQEAEEIKAKLDEEGVFSSPIVTQIRSAEDFYPAEDYHQDFYKRNQTHPYCANVISPKLSKLS